MKMKLNFLFFPLLIYISLKFVALAMFERRKFLLEQNLARDQAGCA
jgi:hypothetical protein